jgi:hypothetical protein
MPEPGRLLPWPPSELQAVLTDAERAFIARWTPREVLGHCHSQRKLVNHLQFWLFTHREPEHLQLAQALVQVFGEALPR